MELTNTQKVGVATVIGIAVGQVANRMLDSRLAKAENPGAINRFMRWNLKQGRNPLWIAISAVANVAIIASMEEKRDGRIGTYVYHEYYGFGKIVSNDVMGGPTVEFLYDDNRIIFNDNSQLTPLPLWDDSCSFKEVLNGK